MYRAALEHILGFKLEGDRLRISPCIPRFWREFEINYRRGSTTYRIKVENPHSLCRGVASVTLDREIQSDDEVKLVDDGKLHEVRVVMGERVESSEPSPVDTPQTAEP